jgi:hypothetical protein
MNSQDKYEEDKIYFWNEEKEKKRTKINTPLVLCTIINRAILQLQDKELIEDLEKVKEFLKSK